MLFNIILTYKLIYINITDVCYYELFYKHYILVTDLSETNINFPLLNEILHVNIKSNYFIFIIHIFKIILQ